jgi:hypothetical protein
VHQEKEIAVMNKPLNVADYNHHMGCVANKYHLTHMEMGEEILLLFVTSVCSEQLHFSIFMWLEVNFTQRFSVCFHWECAGTCWTRPMSREATKGPPSAAGSSIGGTGL